MVESSDASGRGNQTMVESSDASGRGNQTMVESSDASGRGNQTMVESSDASGRANQTMVESSDASGRGNQTVVESSERSDEERHGLRVPLALGAMPFETFCLGNGGVSWRDGRSMKLSLVVSLLMSGLLLATAEQTNSFPPKLNLVTRSDWQAKPAVGEMKAHKPTHITIHHTAVMQKKDRPIEDKLRSLQKFSQNEGALASGKKKPAWPDVPYHYYIAADGRIAEGREVGFVGDTNTEYDPTGHILVVLEGNFETEQPTEAQMKTARLAIKHLAAKYNIPSDKIGTHKDYATTACPGAHLQKKMDSLKPKGNRQGGEQGKKKSESPQ